MTPPRPRSSTVPEDQYVVDGVGPEVLYLADVDPIAPHAAPRPALAWPVVPKLHLAVVLPCYNAAHQLDTVFSALGIAMADLGVIIKVYALDDASTDDTYDRLMIWAMSAPYDIQLSQIPSHQGPMLTVLDGYHRVIEDRNFSPDYVVRLDADTDDDPSEILALVVQRAAFFPDAIALERSAQWYASASDIWRTTRQAMHDHAMKSCGAVPFDPFVAAIAISLNLLSSGLVHPWVDEYRYHWGFDAFMLLQAWHDGAQITRATLRQSRHTRTRTEAQLAEQAQAYSWIIDTLSEG